jgi:ubiquinone/menaquinone biosynthesis C-methylase UbiE
MSDHYERLAGRFEQNWAYSEGFVAWMARNIGERLGPRPGDRVLDAGSGTGLYARGLAEQAGAVVCVDPSPKMLEQLPSDKALGAVCASIEDLASGAVALPYEQFDIILAKEVLHHTVDRVAALRWLASVLAPDGRLLVVMLPPVIRYPLFAAALCRYERHPIEPAGVAATLTEAGLDAEVTYASYDVVISKDRWLVADRYMSLLTKFDDAELQAGIAEIDACHPGPMIEFEDRFAFVLARR